TSPSARSTFRATLGRRSGSTIRPANGWDACRTCATASSSSSSGRIAHSWPKPPRKGERSHSSGALALEDLRSGRGREEARDGAANPERSVGERLGDVDRARQELAVRVLL